MDARVPPSPWRSSFNEPMAGILLLGCRFYFLKQKAGTGVSAVMSCVFFTVNASSSCSRSNSVVRTSISSDMRLAASTLFNNFSLCAKKFFSIGAMLFVYHRVALYLFANRL
jgi:hypothetical protein